MRSNNNRLQIEANNLSRRFGEVQAVSGMNLAIAAGQIYGLVGPDGAGKTTTLRLLCGAIKPDTGQVKICGIPLERQIELARAQIGYLPQRFSLYEDLTVLENIRFFAEIRGLKATEWRPRCLGILDFVGLAPFTNRLAGHLSGGMKQKLGLAAALVHRPTVLLLDEPTTGVDPVTRQDFWQLIIRLAAREPEESVAVLVSTPYMDEAARCTRVGFMVHGRLLIEDTPERLRNRLADQIIELRGPSLSKLRHRAAEDPAVLDAHMFGDQIHLRTLPGKSAAVIKRLQAVHPDITLRHIRPQLEDVFLSILEIEDQAGSTVPESAPGSRT